MFFSQISTEKKKHKKHKKHKHKKGKSTKKKKDKKSKRDSSDDESSSEEEVKQKTQTIAQLRAERLRREQQERKKTNELMLKLSGRSKETSTESEGRQTDYIEYDDRKRSYNSQFNPDLVRKPKRNRQDYLDDFV